MRNASKEEKVRFAISPDSGNQSSVDLPGEQMTIQNLAPCPLQVMRLIAQCVPKSTEERFHSQVLGLISIPVAAAGGCE